MCFCVRSVCSGSSNCSPIREDLIESSIRFDSSCNAPWCPARHWVHWPGLWPIAGHRTARRSGRRRPAAALSIRTLLQLRLRRRHCHSRQLPRCQSTQSSYSPRHRSGTARRSTDHWHRHRGDTPRNRNSRNHILRGIVGEGKD